MYSSSDLAKYPFTPEAIKYIKNLDISERDLSLETYYPIIKQAKRRIEEAIKLSGLNGDMNKISKDLDALSFPVALLMLNVLCDDRVNQRFALYEGKRAYNYFKEENPEKIIQLSKQTYNWDLKKVSSNEKKWKNDELDLILKLHVSHYLRNSVRVKDARRRLINRKIHEGNVYLTKLDAARLLQEEVTQHIRGKLSRKIKDYPRILEQELNEIRQLIDLKIQSLIPQELPENILLQNIPPCISELYRSANRGTNLSHVGRFALTSFLLTLGVSIEKIMEIFKASTDFDIQKTRYQIEHIKGFRGVKRKYLPPRCTTMKTHGLCYKPDNICKTIQHPLTYYRRRVNIAKKKRTFNSRVYREKI